MGLYYTSFIKKLKTEFLKQTKPLEEFLGSDDVKAIYEEYQVAEDSLHWALNIEQLFKELDVIPLKYLERIRKPLDDNFHDWKNDDIAYLKNNKKD